MSVSAPPASLTRKLNCNGIIGVMGFVYRPIPLPPPHHCSCWASFLTGLSGCTEKSDVVRFSPRFSDYIFSEIISRNYTPTTTNSISLSIITAQYACLSFIYLTIKICTYLWKLLNYNPIKVFRKKENNWSSTEQMHFLITKFCNKSYPPCSFYLFIYLINGGFPHAGHLVFDKFICF